MLKKKCLNYSKNLNSFPSLFFLKKFILNEKLIPKILIAPVMITLFGVTIFPLIFAYYMSVHKMTIVNFWHPEFSGIGNYLEIIFGADFWYSLRFSILFMIIVTSIEFLLGLFMAIYFDRPLKGKRFIISFILIPLGIAPALFGIMMKLMLNEFVGIVPFILRQLGITFHFFKDFTSSLITLIWVDVIQWTPFVFIVLYAAIQALPREPMEAAIVDGASKWQLFRYITLPMLKRTLMVILIFRIMDVLKTFDTIYVMTGGGPGISTTTLSIYIFKLALIRGDFGLAAAATILFLYLATIVISFALKYMRKEKVI
jgi:multiple sugar transport system permease protein